MLYDLQCEIFVKISINSKFYVLLLLSNIVRMNGMVCDSQSIMGDDDGSNHGLRTPNEGINQRNLKIWADVADKICSGHT